MKSHTLILKTTLCLFAALAIPSSLVAQNHDNHQPTYITFDVPGDAGGIFPVGINPKGSITGYYFDTNFNGHAFLRDCRGEDHEENCDRGGGTITSFDDPSAVYGTFAQAINSKGTITGYYYDVNQQFVGAHAFVRDHDGTFTTFDVPGDVGYNGTTPAAINPAGVITGYYYDVNSATHGFVRDRDGILTTFDVPGSTSTYAGGINPEGEITGCYQDSNGSHGFVRDRDATITTFDVPNGTNFGDNCSGYVVFGPPRGINPRGEITGTYFETIPGNPFGGNFRGFLRKPEGDLITFDAATYSPCCIWTFGIDITPSGTIMGYLNDGFNKNRGFLRDRNGAITLFDYPNVGHRGTLPTSINRSGAITGYYYDANDNSHGFLRLPGDE